MSTIFISVTDLRARFSEACTEAEQGQKVVITKHGFPYMQLTPIGAALHQKPAKTEEPDAVLIGVDLLSKKEGHQKPAKPGKADTTA